MYLEVLSWTDVHIHGKISNMDGRINTDNTGQNPSHDLGSYVKRVREDRGYSTRGLAALAGIDATYLSRLQRGDYTTPDPHHLRGLAQALEIDPADLYVLAGYTDHHSLPAVAPYLRAKFALPEEVVRQVEEYVEMLNERYGPKGGDDDQPDPRAA